MSKAKANFVQVKQKGRTRKMPTYVTTTSNSAQSIVATEWYKTPKKAKAKAESGAGAPEYWVELDRKRDRKGKLVYWLDIVHRNGKNVFHGQGYSRRIDAMNMLQNFAVAWIEERVEIRERKKK